MARINNDFYDGLGEKWHTEGCHPIALLRAENRLRNPWIAGKIGTKSKVLDIGCGAGFLTNFLAELGHEVSGVDLSQQSLELAKEKDTTKSVSYQAADATQLPFDATTFDVVCAMDLLEHVPDPKAVIAEASRVLRPGGLFFFHTFNRNFWSWLVVIKGVEWCVRNTPPQMHVYPLFIKPSEMEAMCAAYSLTVENLQGVRPKFLTRAFWKMVLTRKVDEAFEFRFTSSLTTGYSGFAKKREY
jgi:2-polyprenyl-6-hydroxyphenyl methylase/3-demethylubiquinone-9 3-methyltransferase